MYPQFVNSFGLLLDIIGAVILFWHSFPQPTFEEGSSLLLEGPEHDEDAQRAKEQKEQYRRISKLGLALLFIGFAFQLVATWL